MERKPYSMPIKLRRTSTANGYDAVCTVLYTVGETDCAMLKRWDGGSEDLSVYDLNGNEIKSLYHDADGKVWDHTETEYNANNGLIKETEYDEAGSVAKVTVHAYDEGGRETECTVYDADGRMLERSVSTYDTRGNWTGRVEYGADGRVLKRLVREYDREGREIKRTEYGEDGAPESSGTVEYGASDEGGYWERWTEYHADGTILDVTLETYDANDNLIRSVRYAGDDSVQSISDTVHDGHGRIAETIYRDGDGKLLERAVFTYSADKKFNRKCIFGPDGELIYDLRLSYGAFGEVVKVIEHDGSGVEVMHAEVLERQDVLLTEPQAKAFLSLCEGIIW